MVYQKRLVSPRIDTRPPILFVDNVLRSTKLVHDIRRQREVAKANKELLKRINLINRTQGFLGVNYDYKAKRFLNWEARAREARRIQRANLVLLERIIDVHPAYPTLDFEKFYRQFSKYGKIVSKQAVAKRDEQRQKVKDLPDCHSVRIQFCERNDRKLGSLKINMFKTDVLKYLLNEGIVAIRGRIYRIYRDQYVVIRGHVSIPDASGTQKRQLIENVERGSLLRAIINDQPALLLTLGSFQRLANCQLLGLVDAPNEEMLNLLNYYGTTWGRMLEPLCFRIEIK
ncbi:uncharacterized protein LOC128743864 [Sabethes cyaneus]|uniref:uncharacterized protein LOC128743864 n=1 Tax=Sabethes cyaneus TaxID=53552 RepID=UPI00237DFDDE|nr:uncharacterized protein LOC128743864 [Sabethes cyaneus]